jgi:hypothetical protein
MPGLVPGIHVLLLFGLQDVDGRDKPGHDELVQRKRNEAPYPLFLNPAEIPLMVS